MEFMGKKLEDIVVTLPFADGTSADFGVYSYFEVNNKKYFALLPLKGEKELDFTKNYMLYEVQEDEEHNPIILYIESNRANKALPFTRKFAASEANQGCMASILFFFPVFILSVVMLLMQNVFPASEWVIAVLLLGLNSWWMAKGFSSKKNTDTVSV